MQKGLAGLPGQAQRICIERLPQEWKEAPMTRPRIVLTFHGIGTPPDTVPEDERPYWIAEAGFRTVVAQLAQDARRLDVELTLTFDDGNRSDLEIGAPVLADHGVTGIVFPCASRLGQAGYLDGADLQTLIGSGFEIGSHGMDHVPWAGLSADALHREVATSRTMLEAAIGQPVTCAALPFGAYDRRALAAIRAAGYARVYSSDPGLAAPGAWFVRRMSYHPEVAFDVPGILATQSGLGQRLLGAVKHRIKALR